MKNSDMILFGALALGGYMLLGKKPAESNTNNNQDSWSGNSGGILPGTVTPSGNVVTAPITTVQNGVDYINTEVLNKKTPSKSNSVVQASKTSLNGNQYLASRVGGGYSIVGAKNVTLKPSNKSSR